jgi:hypothetical protein
MDLQTLKRFSRLLSLAFVIGCSASSSAAQEPAERPQNVPDMPTVSEPAPLEVAAGEFDNGKMWTFEYPPLEYFRDEYGFNPDSAWFAGARLGALRIPRCSASFVSPNGLVMTNHHCARESATAVSQPGESLLDNGFYASALEDERALEDQRADQLIAIIDVTEEIFSGIAAASSDAERATLLQAAEEAASRRISDEYGGEDADIVVEVIELWNGARYSAYVFHRYMDVRLVMAPELKIGMFGGDPDNFTYPRYNLDMSFFRIYDDDGNPLQTDNYFSWSEEGVQEGDAVFVIGNPGGSSRLQTVAQLEWRGAARDKTIADLYASRAAVYDALVDEDPEKAEELDLRNLVADLLNSEKAYRGMWRGLQNPEYMARRRDSERQFLVAIADNPALNAEYAGLVDEMAGIQERRTEYADEFSAFIAIGSPMFTSAVVQRALSAYQYLAAQAAGAPEAALSQVKDQIRSIEDQPSTIQGGLLTARLRDIETYLGADSEIGSEILLGRTPEQTSDAILAHSALADSDRAAAALESGSLTMTDPAVHLVATAFDAIVEYQSAFQQLGQQEAGVAASLGRARFDVYGTSIPPDATFSLRIADGIVTGYPYNGTYAPIYTTFYGLYDHFYSYGPDSDWDLPENWQNPPASFDLSKPLNFVLTADVIGGSSGAPVINEDLEIVGLIFDGNIESLPGDYIFDPEINRSVAVDVRGILEALDEMYDADRIVLELTTGRLAETEAEADRVMAGSRN